MTDIATALRNAVLRRAGNRCEYCGLAQVGQEAAFHIDHVIPRSGGGPTDAANLALACVSCSLRKGARRMAADVETGHDVSLFNPRADRWTDHFRWDEALIVPLTPVGRATVAALAMNRPLVLAIRREEAERGRHPPVMS